MPHYRVVISGTNLLLVLDDEQTCFEFEVTRFVEAHTEDEAAAAALAMIRDSRQIASAKNAAFDPPRYGVTRVERLPASQTVPPHQPGFAFSPRD